MGTNHCGEWVRPCVVQQMAGRAVSESVAGMRWGGTEGGDGGSRDVKGCEGMRVGCAGTEGKFKIIKTKLRL